MELGSIVDCLTTTPHLFDDTYAIKTMEGPSSEQQRNFVEEIVDTYISGVTPQADVIWANHYSTKGKDEEAIVKASKALFEKLKPYMEYLINVKQNGLIEITEEIYEKAKNIAEAIKKHPIANKWFIEMPGEYQKELWWKSSASDLQIKGFLDKVVYDHENKRALVLDLKIMDCKNENQFKGKVRKFWYHGQMYSYTTGVAQSLFNAHKEHYDVSHIFVVVNSNEPHQVMCITLEDSDLEIGGTQFIEALEKINARRHSGDWTHSKEVVKLQVFKTD